MSACVLPTCPELDPVVDTGSFVCDRCERGLVRQLAEVETYLELITPVRLRRPTERSAPGFHSSSPANDSVIAMLDPRSCLSADDPLMPVVGVISGWARIVLDEHPATAPPSALSDAVTLLRTHAGWLCRQPWIDEAAAELDAVHRQLRAEVGDTPPRPIAQCITVDDTPCGGAVYWVPGAGDDARCSRCKRIYNGLALIRLRVAQES